MWNPRLTAIATAILAAAASRLLPHPPNFTPMAAMALFAGAYVPNRILAVLLPLAAVFLSDLVLGFYPDMATVYLSFALVVGIGFLLRRARTPLRIGAAALSASVLFFVVTNFGTWAVGQLYPKTPAGLVECYVAAIPFFRNSLLADAFYTLLLFGGFALLEEGWPAFRERRRAQLQSV